MARLYPPKFEYQFEYVNEERAIGQFWRMPTRLVTGGDLARWWRPAGDGLRGGGSIASVLPVLAVHTSATAPRVLPDDAPNDQWTPWTQMSRNKLATLGGLADDTASKALGLMRDLKLVETQKLPSGPPDGGPDRAWYRVSLRMYPTPGEHYVEIPKRFIYAGTWAALPTAACRQLYLAIAGVDPVRNEVAYLGDSDGSGRDWSEDLAADTLERKRQAFPLSLARLRQLTGIGNAETIIRARRDLTAPAFNSDWPDFPSTPGDGAPTVPLVLHGPSAHGAEWFAPNRAAWDLQFDPTWLNERMRELRQLTWPAPVGGEGGANDRAMRQAA